MKVGISVMRIKNKPSHAEHKADGFIVQSSGHKQTMLLWLMVISQLALGKVLDVLKG